MHIGIDVRNLAAGALTGIGRYVLHQSEHLAQLGARITLFSPTKGNHVDRLAARLGAKNAMVNSAASSSLSRIAWGETQLPQMAKSAGIDVLWGPAHRLPPRMNNGPAQVLTIHDLVWRQAAATMPLARRLSERVLMPLAVSRADGIVAVSQATAIDVVAEFPLNGKILRVIHPGVPERIGEFAALPEPLFSQNRPFALAVATQEPRKNLLRLVAAYLSLLPETRKACRLVIAGASGWKLPDLAMLVESKNAAEDVVFLGPVSDAVLSALYNSCRFSVFVSLFEGFGLPVIEAHQHGKAVLTSNVSSLPEVGGAAALYVNPLDVAVIAQGFERLALNDAMLDALASKAKENAARFSWRESGKALMKLFETVCR